MIKLYNRNSLELLSEIKKEYENMIIVTDPPFNVGYHYNKYKDNMDEEEYYLMLYDVFLGTGYTPFVVIHYPEALHKITHVVGMMPDRVCSWVYNSNTAKQHRDVAFYGVKPDFSQVSQPYKNPNDKRIQKRIAEGKTCKLYDWWNINQVKNVSKEKTSHPCQMPLEVMKNIVGVLPKGSIIVDPFMGSGTTGVACKELGYDFIGIELDDEYFEIAKDRIENYDIMKEVQDDTSKERNS